MLTQWTHSQDMDLKYAADHGFEPKPSEQVPGKVFHVRCKQCGKIYVRDQRKRIFDHDWKHRERGFDATIEAHLRAVTNA